MAFKCIRYVCVHEYRDLFSIRYSHFNPFNVHGVRWTVQCTQRSSGMCISVINIRQHFRKLNFCITQFRRHLFSCKLAIFYRFTWFWYSIFAIEWKKVEWNEREREMDRLPSFICLHVFAITAISPFHLISFRHLKIKTIEAILIVCGM